MYQVIRRVNCVRTILAVAVYSVMRELFICLVEAQEMISSIISRGTIYGTLADVVYATDRKFVENRSTRLSSTKFMVFSFKC